MITADMNPAPDRVLSAIIGMQGHFKEKDGPSTDIRQEWMET